MWMFWCIHTYQNTNDMTTAESPWNTSAMVHHAWYMLDGMSIYSVYHRSKLRYSMQTTYCNVNFQSLISYDIIYTHWRFQIWNSVYVCTQSDILYTRQLSLHATCGASNRTVWDMYYWCDPIWYWVFCNNNPQTVPCGITLPHHCLQQPPCGVTLNHLILLQHWMASQKQFDIWAIVWVSVCMRGR